MDVLRGKNLPQDYSVNYLFFMDVPRQKSLEEAVRLNSTEII